MMEEMDAEARLRQLVAQTQHRHRVLNLKVCQIMDRMTKSLVYRDVVSLSYLDILLIEDEIDQQVDRSGYESIVVIINDLESDPEDEWDDE